MIEMMPLLPDRIPDVWSEVWPLLEPSVMRQGKDFDAVEATKLIMTGRTQIWLAIEDREALVGAMATTVCHDGDHAGKKCLDVHSLGGKKFNDWSPQAAKLMRDWATVNDCHRIIFQGRYGLRRLHKPLGKVEEIGRDGEEYLYEVKL